MRRIHRRRLRTPPQAPVARRNRAGKLFAINGVPYKPVDVRVTYGRAFDTVTAWLEGLKSIDIDRILHVSIATLVVEMADGGRYALSDCELGDPAELESSGVLKVTIHGKVKRL
jgi:hypothetical protein